MPTCLLLQFLHRLRILHRLLILRLSFRTRSPVVCFYHHFRTRLSTFRHKLMHQLKETVGWWVDETVPDLWRLPFPLQLTREEVETFLFPRRDWQSESPHRLLLEKQVVVQGTNKTNKCLSLRCPLSFQHLLCLVWAIVWVSLSVTLAAPAISNCNPDPIGHFPCRWLWLAFLHKGGHCDSGLLLPKKVSLLRCQHPNDESGQELLKLLLLVVIGTRTSLNCHCLLQQRPRKALSNQGETFLMSAARGSSSSSSTCFCFCICTLYQLENILHFYLHHKSFNYQLVQPHIYTHTFLDTCWLFPTFSREEENKPSLNGFILHDVFGNWIYILKEGKPSALVVVLSLQCTTDWEQCITQFWDSLEQTNKKPRTRTSTVEECQQSSVLWLCWAAIFTCKQERSQSALRTPTSYLLTSRSS